MINLTISADSAEELLQQLNHVAMRLVLGAGLLDPDSPTPEMATPPDNPTPRPPAMAAAEPPKEEKGNGADAVSPKRTRGKAKPEPALEPALDRQAIIKGLTDIYMSSPPAIRDKITAFRDSYGVQRLRELKDEVIPAAAKLLSELQASVETAQP